MVGRRGGNSKILDDGVNARFAALSANGSLLEAIVEDLNNTPSTHRGPEAEKESIRCHKKAEEMTLSKYYDICGQCQGHLN